MRVKDLMIFSSNSAGKPTCVSQTTLYKKIELPWKTWSQVELLRNAQVCLSVSGHVVKPCTLIETWSIPTANNCPQALEHVNPAMVPHKNFRLSANFVWEIKQAS